MAHEPGAVITEPTVEPFPSGAPRKPRRRRRVVIAVFVVVMLVVAAVALGYRRQITAYLTHWKGSPTHTVPYVPFDPPPRVRIAVAGDIGDSGSRLDATAAAIAALGAVQHYDALLLLGDNVYPSGDPAELPSTVFTPFGATLDSGTELLAIVGNHDVKEGHGDAQMAALGMPGRWWAEQIDDVLVVGLDSNDIENPAQLAFLDETLAATDATWRIVAVHHPPYSAGYQGSNHDVRDAIKPIIERHGVQLVLSGHDHDYQRSEVIDGVTYVVSGAAAGTRRTSEASFTAESFSWHHFVDIAVFDDRLVLRAVNQDERVADEAVLSP
jgi:3',5'-cyclic AMP phosphodiesterase CpdA